MTCGSPINLVKLGQDLSESRTQVLSSEREGARKLVLVDDGKDLRRGRSDSPNGRQDAARKGRQQFTSETSPDAADEEDGTATNQTEHGKAVTLRLGEMFLRHLVDVVHDFKLMFQQQIDEIMDINDGVAEAPKQEGRPSVHTFENASNVPQAAPIKPGRKSTIKLQNMQNLDAAEPVESVPTTLA